MIFNHKTLIICVLLFHCMVSVFSNEKQKNLSDIDIIMNNEVQHSMEMQLLSKYYNRIFCGSSLLGISIIPAAGMSFIIFPYGICWFLIALEHYLALSAVGVSIMSNGIYLFHRRYQSSADTSKQLFFRSKSRNYFRIAIPNIAIVSVSAVSVAAGIVMTIFGKDHVKYYVYDDKTYSQTKNPVRFAGIFLDVFGGLGLLVCLPMMIASLAMSAWCKGQLAQISPDISLTHDDGKTFSEGYGVSLGLRVRI